MEYVFTPRARRNLRGFDRSTQRRIVKKIKFYLNTSDPLKFAKILTDSPYGTYRFRVLGKIRVVFIHEPEEDRIVITRIRFRKDAY